VTPTQLRRVSIRLAAFAEDLFESISRKDQRRRGHSYLRGLLLDGKGRSIHPMAARLARGDPGADANAIEKALQQFVNQSASATNRSRHLATVCGQIPQLLGDLLAQPCHGTTLFYVNELESNYSNSGMPVLRALHENQPGPADRGRDGTS
jgi:hypothetical protein